MAKSIIEYLIANRNEKRFWLYFKKVKVQVGRYNAISNSKLPRIRRIICNFHNMLNSINITSYTSTSNTLFHDEVKSYHR